MAELNGNGAYSWLPKRTLLSLIGLLLSGVVFAGSCYVQGIDSTCKANTLELKEVKTKQIEDDKRWEDVRRKLERIDDKLDRIRRER